MIGVNIDLAVDGLFEDAPCGLVAHRPNGSIVVVNRTLSTWLGRPKTDLLGSAFADLLTLPGRLFYENQYAPLLRMQGSVQDAAFELARPGQAPLPVLITSVQQLDGAGHPRLVVSTLFDATDRRRYERELLNARRRAEQLAAVVTASGDAIMLLGRDGDVRTWNAGAGRMFGRSEAEMLQHPVSTILPELRGPKWDAVVDRLRSGERVQVDTRGLRGSGEGVDVSVALAPHMGLLNELDAISLIGRDVAARRKLERLQQEFLAMAGHELRNPVAAIRGHAQLAQRRQSYSESSVRTIVQQTELLNRLIEDLLLASQIEADRLDLRMEVLDLVAEVQAAVAPLRTDGREFTVEVAGTSIEVTADRHRLAQVLGNLLTNAVKYSGPAAPIRVEVASAGAMARVAISDQGIGIPAESIPQLFDRFYRVRGAAAQSRGLGLGLYITRRIVDAHGGTVTVRSEVGRGSTFTITLPLPVRDTTSNLH